MPFMPLRSDDKDNIQKCETGIPDTLLYVVNFENDNGYAILSANTILSESVFCITETGQMVLDTTGISIPAHPDLGDGIERAVNEWEDRELSDEEAEADTLYISGISPDESERTVQELVVSRVIVDIYNYENTHVKPVEKEVDRPTTGPATNKFGPYLKTKWRQEEPFNKLVPSQYCGCVAIATGQIMVSNRHSNSMTFNGKPCNWDDLESVCNYASPNFLGGKDAKEQASNFIYELGKKYNINTKYDQGGSGALPKNARRTLKNYGYSNVKLHTGFGKKNQEKAKDQIRHGHPVFLGGNRGLNNGHAWVLDGYYYDADASLFHINWGWYGAADGYYACGLFDTSLRADTDDEIDENTKDSKPNEDHNYTWCFRMITYD